MNILNKLKVDRFGGLYFSFGIILIITFIYLVFPPSGLPDALTCESMDKFLEDDMLGKIELTKNDKQTLLEGMDWCMAKGYEVKPLTGLTDYQTQPYRIGEVP
uniref:ORF42 n=1 Tax=Nitrosopumilaceae spindle-shaped virus TaxID=3065433 RepID=A0AAT9JA50_9VIRU